MQMKESFYSLPGCPIHIALLSDLHNRPFARIIDSLQHHKPELVCISGDVIYGARPEGNTSPLVSQTNVMPFLSACCSIAPTYFSLGNHEQFLDDEDIRTIGKTGVIVLDNSWREAKKGVIIGGLTSAYVTDYRRFREGLNSGERYPKKERPSEDAEKPAKEAEKPAKGHFKKDAIGEGKGVIGERKDTIGERKDENGERKDTIGERYPKKDVVELKKEHADHIPDTSWFASFCSKPGYHILLSHHPEYYPLVPGEIQLTLSGHGHGGQWRFYNPFKRKWQGVFAPGQGWFPRYTKGVYDGRLVVSAGLSNTAGIPRINNPTEIVFLG